MGEGSDVLEPGETVRHCNRVLTRFDDLGPCLIDYRIGKGCRITVEADGQCIIWGGRARRGRRRWREVTGRRPQGSSGLRMPMRMRSSRGDRP